MPVAGARWRNFFRGVWLVTTALVIIAVPWMSLAMKKQDYSIHAIAWFTAGEGIKVDAMRQINDEQ